MVLRPGVRGMEAFQLVVPTAAPEPPAEFAHVTEETETGSEAVPLSRTEAASVMNDPADVGPVMVIPGAVFSRMTVIAAVVEFPEASEALTVITCEPIAR